MNKVGKFFRHPLLVSVTAICLSALMALLAGFQGPQSNTLFAIPEWWLYSLFLFPLILFVLVRWALRRMDRISE